jgi:hypothetical protein
MRFEFLHCSYKGCRFGKRGCKKSAGNAQLYKDTILCYPEEKMNLKGTPLCHCCYKWLKENTDDHYNPIPRNVPVEDPMIEEESNEKIDDFDWSKEFAPKFCLVIFDQYPISISTDGIRSFCLRASRSLYQGL